MTFFLPYCWFSYQSQFVTSGPNATLKTVEHLKDMDLGLWSLLLFCLHECFRRSDLVLVELVHLDLMEQKRYWDWAYAPHTYETFATAGLC